MLYTLSVKSQAKDSRLLTSIVRLSWIEFLGAVSVLKLPDGAYQIEQIKDGKRFTVALIVRKGVKFLHRVALAFSVSSILSYAVDAAATIPTKTRKVA